MFPSDVLPDAHRWVKRLLRLHRPIVFTIEIATTFVAGVVAFLLRFDLEVPIADRFLLLLALSFWIPIKLATFILFGVYRSSWRYVSLRDFTRLVFSNIVASSLSAAALILVTSGIPRSVYLIQFLLCLALAAGLRVAVRLLIELGNARRFREERKRTVIYGAGEAGVALYRELLSNPALLYRVCGFIDDQPRKTGLTIHGSLVLGTGAALPTLVQRHNLELVLIAIPSATGAEMINILKCCNAAGIAYQTVPGLGDRIKEHDLVHQIRDVAVEDLLGRLPVRLEQDRISAKFENRTVLVTGAAGSIGSELCRQIARFKPAKLIGFEISETGLFHLEQEMMAAFPNVTFCPEIGSIQNPQRLAEVFDRYHPTIVYHAAAYKHVPMMEAHVFEAIENNVFGTLNVALAAGRSNVEDFVMISSDKAVSPTNIMGASKRIAELIVRSLQNGSGKYVSVRFGNVLGSNGSVVPIFKRQIAAGGPITITHPDMKRYFMTIPEASQLVLQSSTMGKGGEIFVLDMGEPVRILDLARNLILLSGLRPDEDIKIKFTGARPGEKLFEELNLGEEDMLPTYHEKIKIFAGCCVPWSAMELYLARLRYVCNFRNFNELLLTLKEIVPDYNPSMSLLQRALTQTPHARAMAAGELQQMEVRLIH